MKFHCDVMRVQKHFYEPLKQCKVTTKSNVVALQKVFF